jgi:hypothetical protein
MLIHEKHFLQLIRETMFLVTNCNIPYIFLGKSAEVQIACFGTGIIRHRIILCHSLHGKLMVEVTLFEFF